MSRLPLTKLLTREELIACLAEQGLEVSYRTLRYYASLGLLQNPRLQAGPDGRNRSYYPEQTIDCVIIISLLQAQGLNLQQVKEAMEQITGEAQGEAAQFTAWREQVQAGRLPLLFELLPQLGDDLRRHLVSMLRLAGLPPLAASLGQVRLAVRTTGGESVERLLFLPPDDLQLAPLNFWELPELTELLAKIAPDERRRSLIQVRTWLQGRHDWALENFWLARHQRQPVGCLGLQRPWPLRLQAAGKLYGPFVQPAYAALGLGEALLAAATKRARALGLDSLTLTLDACRPDALAAASALPTGWQLAARGFSCLLATAKGESEDLPTSRVQPLAIDLLRAMFPTQPPILLSQAASDSSTPGWALLDQTGRPLAAAWLSLSDQEIWLHYPSAEQQPPAGLATLLETVKAAARAKGLFHLSSWLPAELEVAGVVERTPSATYRLCLKA